MGPSPMARPELHLAARLSLIVYGVQMRFQLHGVLFRGRAPNRNWSPRSEIAMLDLSRAPGESAPHLFVVIDLNWHQLAALLGDNL